MKAHRTRLVPMALAGGLALALVVGVVMGGIVGSPFASAQPAAPNPGHLWTEMEDHGIDGGDYWLGPTVDQALELHVNGSRALRLEPVTDITFGATANLTGGYSGNSITSGIYGATIGGGGRSPDVNSVTGNYGTVGGGRGNTAGAVAAVAGGEQNSASGAASTVAGGGFNTASDSHATVGGGYGNTASGLWMATVGGGKQNTASGTYATVAGGQLNRAHSGNHPTVGGGYDNSASGDSATVGGGRGNVAVGTGATVGGGDGNNANTNHTTVGGGDTNRVTDAYGTVGGGENNQAGDDAGTTIDRTHATVGGGKGNTATEDYSTESGGTSNAASGQNSTVAGGGGNTASGQEATVGGGYSNEAAGSYATVGGGYDNTASGNYATVSGGFINSAAGEYSFAAGKKARANNAGCFIWGDSGIDPQYVDCDANNQFKVYSSGGIYLYTSRDGSTGQYLVGGSSSWSTPSSRDVKENFAELDGQEILVSLAGVPINTWNYKAQDDAIRHAGAVAEDFYDAFGLGESDTAISSVDVDGVALAAIQGLYELSQEQGVRVQALETENSALQQRLDSLEARVTALEEGTGGAPLVSGASSSGLPSIWLLLGGGLGVVVLGLVLARRRLAGGRR